MIEIQSQRAERQKVFDVGNGKKQYEIHAKPIHYKNENDDWEDINVSLQLKPTEKTFNHFIAEKNKFTVGFRADNKTDKMVGIRRDKDRQFEITPLKVDFDGNDKLAKTDLTKVDGKKSTLVAEKKSVDKYKQDSIYNIEQEIDTDFSFWNKVSEVALTNAVKTTKIVNDFTVQEQIHLKGFEVINIQNKSGEYIPDNRGRFVFQSVNNPEDKLWIPQPRMWVDENVDNPINIRNSSRGISHTLEQIKGELIYTKTPTQEGLDWLNKVNYNELYIDSTTYYGDTSDGYIYIFGNPSWSDTHGALTGESIDISSSMGYLAECEHYDGDYTITRSFFEFDTSGISDSDTIDSCDFMYKCFSASGTVAIQKGTQASTLTVDDYDAFSGSEYGSGVSSLNWNTIPFNSTGLADINKTGYTKICTREEHDFDDIAPTSTNEVAIFFADNSGTDKDPKLVIETSAGATSPTVSTASATNVSTDEATLNGSLDDDGGESCDVYFEYGTDTSYGNTTSTQTASTGDGFADTISGLQSSTTYHYRAVATNSAGTAYGDDVTVTTSLVTETGQGSIITISASSLSGAGTTVANCTTNIISVNISTIQGVGSATQSISATGSIVNVTITSIIASITTSINAPPSQKANITANILNATGNTETTSQSSVAVATAETISANGSTSTVGQGAITNATTETQPATGESIVNATGEMVSVSSEILPGECSTTSQATGQVSDVTASIINSGGTTITNSTSDIIPVQTSILTASGSIINIENATGQIVGASTEIIPATGEVTTNSTAQITDINVSIINSTGKTTVSGQGSVVTANTSTLPSTAVTETTAQGQMAEIITNIISGHGVAKNTVNANGQIIDTVINSLQATGQAVAVGTGQLANISATIISATSQTSTTANAGIIITNITGIPASGVLEIDSQGNIISVAVDVIPGHGTAETNAESSIVTVTPNVIPATGSAISSGTAEIINVISNIIEASGATITTSGSEVVEVICTTIPGTAVVGALSTGRISETGTNVVTLNAGTNQVIINNGNNSVVVNASNNGVTINFGVNEVITEDG